MRIRLLIDTVFTDDEITRLAEVMAEQPTCLVELSGWPTVIGGRFMGAQPVHADEVEALMEDRRPPYGS